MADCTIQFFGNKSQKQFIEYFFLTTVVGITIQHFEPGGESTKIDIDLRQGAWCSEVVKD